MHGYFAKNINTSVHIEQDPDFFNSLCSYTLSSQPVWAQAMGGMPALQ